MVGNAMTVEAAGYRLWPSDFASGVSVLDPAVGAGWPIDRWHRLACVWLRSGRSVRFDPAESRSSSTMGADLHSRAGRARCW